MGALTRAVRNVSRRKMRALLVIIALGFSMAIMISIPAGIVANQEITARLTDNFSTTISTMQEEINKTSTLIECQNTTQGVPSGMPSGMPMFWGAQENYIDGAACDEIRSAQAVKDTVEFFQKSSQETTSETIGGLRGRNFTISRPLYTINGVCLTSSSIDNYSTLPTNITAGRNLQEGDTGVVVIGSNLTEYFGVDVGGIVNIYGESFTVVGICETTGQGRMQIRNVYMNISDAQTITGNTGSVSRLDVYVEDVSDVDAIVQAITASYPELYVTTYKDRLENLQNMQEMSEETLNNAESTLSQTQTIATQEIIVAVAATSLIVLFVMLYTVRERTKEIGTFKAIGFSNWDVMSQFMLEGILISLMAAVVGIAIGSIAAPTLSSLLLPHVNLFSGSRSGGFQPVETANFRMFGSQAASVTLDPQLILLAFGAAVVLGAVGSLYPAWRAARIRPAEAMRYE